jgi:hypothetical protein
MGEVARLCRGVAQHRIAVDREAVEERGEGAAIGRAL